MKVNINMLTNVDDDVEDDNDEDVGGEGYKTG